MTRRNRIAALAVLLPLLGLLAAGLPGSASADPRPDSYVLPGATVFPEGVAYDRGSGYFYVSSTTDGTIFRGNLWDPQTSAFLPGGADGRTSAAGMKVDGAGRLFISGAATGKMFVYDTATGSLIAAFDDDRPVTFINDVAVTRDGEAYYTDSLDPVLYRVSPDHQGQFHLEAWLSLVGSPIVYQSGFNLNGIALTPDGRSLIVVQSNTGRLYKIDIASQQIDEINIGGQTVTAGDGILLRGHTLYVMRNSLELLVKIELSEDYLSGTIVSATTDASFAFPTTMAIANGRLLVVNSQFDRRPPGPNPDLPFTVSSVSVP